MKFNHPVGSEIRRRPPPPPRAWIFLHVDERFRLLPRFGSLVAKKNNYINAPRRTRIRIRLTTFGGTPL